MTLNHIKSRTHKILEAVILSYAESAVPVGSEYLWEKYRWGVSPATIRNTLAELESQGLITHPHTSAGRVPTDLGYRYYADLLMQPQRLRPEEEAGIESLARIRTDDPFELLDNAAQLLAELTQEAGVVLVPQLSHAYFRQFRLIQVGDQDWVGLLIASEGMIKHAALELHQPIALDLLERLERFLNEELSGMPLARIPDYLKNDFFRDAEQAFPSLPDEALSWIQSGSLFEEEPEVILEGTSRMLEEPEFRDVQRTRRLLKGLERKADLVDILARDLAADEVRFHIGSENKGTLLTDCTIAAAPYRLKGGVMGTLGVIGPTRLNYPRVRTLVKKVAETLSRTQQDR